MNSMQKHRPPAAVVTGLFWDVGLVLIAYYGLRLLGADDYQALLAATVIAGGRVVVVAIKDRRVDLFAGFLLAVFGASLLFAVLVHDARIALLGHSVSSCVAGLLFLASVVMRRPLTFAAARRAAATDEACADMDRRWAASAGFRSCMYQLSTLWGVGLLVEAALRVPLVLTLPLDVSTAASSVLQIGAIVILVAATRAVVARARSAESEVAGCGAATPVR